MPKIIFLLFTGITLNAQIQVDTIITNHSSYLEYEQGIVLHYYTLSKEDYKAKKEGHHVKNLSSKLLKSIELIPYQGHYVKPSDFYSLKVGSINFAIKETELTYFIEKSELLDDIHLISKLSKVPSRKSFDNWHIAIKYHNDNCERVIELSNTRSYKLPSDIELDNIESLCFKFFNATQEELNISFEVLEN